MDKNHFNWPINQNFELDKQLRLLKSLISYSTNFTKLEVFSKEQDLKYLDELSENQQLINEYNRKGSISSEIIDRYKYFLKSQLMSDLIKNNSTEYFDIQNIIKFFNQFNDPHKPIESYWMIKAQKLSQKYSNDFCISIPDFSQTDIVFLLINPITKEKSFLLKEIDVPSQLFDYLYEISAKKIESFDKLKIEIFEIIKKYVKSSFQKEFDLISTSTNLEDCLKQILERNLFSKNLQNLFLSIQNAIEIGSKITSKQNLESLDFSDFEDLNNLDFNLFVNKYPVKGFLISQFPEIKSHMNMIYRLWGNKKEKFPLGLFEFRIFSKFQKIEFQIPNKESNDAFNEIKEIISNEIASILSENDIYFCHFIEFLLPKIPSFMTELYHSDYIRDIIISLLTVPKDKTIQQYIIVYLKEFIPKILKKIGSLEWKNLINEELKYETKDEIICFLANPWKFVLEQIDETIRPGYSMNLNAAKDIFSKMKTMINSITTEKSIKELNKCVIEDIELIKEKLIQDYNIAKNSIITNQDVSDKWTIYSQQVSSFISIISNLPTTSMASSSPPLLPGQSFDEFYDFFSQNLSSFSNNESRIIAFLPKKANSNTNYVHNLQYTYNGKNVEIHFRITGKVMLFCIPYDIQIESLKMVSTSLLFKILKIKYNHFKSKLSPSISGIIRSYKQFNESNKRLSSNSSRVDDCNRIENEISQADIVFGKFNVNEFIQRLNQMKSELPNSFKNIKELNETTNNLKNELIILTDVHYANKEITKPPKTLNFLRQYLRSDDLLDTIDLNSFMNFLECFPEYDGIYSELDQLLYNSNLFLLRPKNDHVIFDGNFEKDSLIEHYNNLLSPLIFKEGNKLIITAKSIEINCNSLVFGVDLLPLQIRIFNYTDEELICQFEQANKELPLPTYKNEHEFLIIEIPVESICKNENNSDEKTFIFEGKILLSTKYDCCISTKIDYKIKLNYVSSNLNELKSNSFETIVNNYSLNKSDFVSFPTRITIASFYQKFNEILSTLYFLPSNIFNLIKNNEDYDQIQTMLNQLQTIYLWEKESSTCFPFCSFQTKFNKALSLILSQLHQNKLNLSNFPNELIHNELFYHDFVQLPKLR